MWLFRINGLARFVLMSVCLCICLSGHAQIQTMAAPRAIWMWEAASYAMLEQEAVATDNIAFMKAKGINTLYLYADAYQGQSKILYKTSEYESLIKRLHREGFQVYALLGSWYLKTWRYVLPEERNKARRMFQQVLNYNASVSVDAQFDGINLDIEPHMLDEWDTQKLNLLTQWVELSHDLMNLKRQSKLSLKVGPAIPFWLDGISLQWAGQWKPVSQHLQDVYDYVALMDYRDRADGGDGMISHAENEMAYAQSIGKKVVLGIETGPNEIQKVSFNHLQEADMLRELSKVENAYSRQGAWGGFVIHHFESYRRWLQQGAN
jgi:chitinase